jgi:regulation of enolase protein 1 (concanavalin A-like superfamily)
MVLSCLHETFERPAVDPQLKWYCEPAKWEVDAAKHCLKIETDAGTDYWQRTHYGFQADNGHFLFAEASGDFIMTAHVRFRPVHQYDQAGLMVRLSAACWLKTSVEYELDEPGRLGAVVTNDGYSDWSTQVFPPGRGETWLRIRRAGADYTVEASSDGEVWEQIRLAHLHADTPGGTVACGLYACSPKDAGFVAEFSFLRIDRPAG